MNHRERVQKAQALMAQEGIDALLILSLEDYYYFTGDMRKQPRALIPREGEPTLLVFAGEEEEVRRASWIQDVRGYRALHEMMTTIIAFFNDLGVEHPKVGVEMEFATPAFLLERFRMANPTVELADAKPVIAPLRKIKDAEEIARIREAARIADIGMETAAKVIREGVREIVVATEVEYAMKKAGAERMAFPIFVNSGYRSLWLHGMATTKIIGPRDLVLVDLGPVYGGYCADLCRTFVVGEGTADQQALYGAYQAMQEAVVGALRPGVQVFELEEQAQAVADKRGYGAFYVRGFLHGIGLGFEELPFPTIFPEDIMEALVGDMTLSVGHSTLSVPGIGGVRVEDTLLLREDGVEVLTRYPKDLQEVG